MCVLVCTGVPWAAFSPVKAVSHRWATAHPTAANQGGGHVLQGDDRSLVFCSALTQTDIRFLCVPVPLASELPVTAWWMLLSGVDILTGACWVQEVLLCMMGFFFFSVNILSIFFLFVCLFFWHILFKSFVKRRFQYIFLKSVTFMVAVYICKTCTCASCTCFCVVRVLCHYSLATVIKQSSVPTTFHPVPHVCAIRLAVPWE